MRAVVSLLLVGAACSQGVVSENPQPSKPRSSVSESATSIASQASAVGEPKAIGVPSATSPIEAPIDPTVPTLPRMGALGSTKGTISCGQERCDASTFDCEWSAEARRWACVPQTTPKPDGSDASEHPFLVRCDDASDCALGERCCQHKDNLVYLSQRCAPRSDVDGCRQEICHEGGAACPAGTTCERLPDENFDPQGLQGACVAPRGSATCVGKKRCPADRSACVISEAGPSCEAADSKAFSAANVGDRLMCTRQSDCLGEEMCSYGYGEMRTLGTMCGRWSSGLSGTLVCDPGGAAKRKATAVELARVCGANPGCREKLVCKPGGKLPWLGLLYIE